MSETSKFTRDILAAANEKAQSIINAAELETQKALEDAKSHLSREAEEVIRNAQAEAEAIRRRQISEVKHKMKLREQQDKNRILSDVLEETRKRFFEIASQEDKYQPFLVELIAHGVDALRLDTAVVHLCARDLNNLDIGRLHREVAKKLKQQVTIEWSKDPIDTHGGALIASTDGKTRIVNTLDQRFEALEPKLLIEAGKTLFGD